MIEPVNGTSYRRTEASKRITFVRPGHNLGDAEQATKTALRRLARRHQQLSEEIAEAAHELDQLVHQVAPELLALPWRWTRGRRPGVHQCRRQPEPGQV